MTLGAGAVCVLLAWLPVPVKAGVASPCWSPGLGSSSVGACLLLPTVCSLSLSHHLGIFLENHFIIPLVTSPALLGFLDSRP